MVVANIRYGIARTAENGLGLQRHRAAPVTVAWIMGHVVGDNAPVLTVYRHLHVVTALGGTDSSEREPYDYNSCPFDAPKYCLAPHNLLRADELNYSKRTGPGKRRGLEARLGTGRPQV